MKKFTLITLVILIAGFSAKTFAQAKRHIFLEHFTNACCGPCAQSNPIFDTAVLTKNLSYVKHCSYHTDWPGSDPMNTFNPGDVGARVTYYSVTGVPNMRMMGNKFNGAPSAVNVKMINNLAYIPCPLQVKVKETTSGSTRQVKVVVYTLSPMPSGGNYKVRTAVCESLISYTTAPGSNGEKKFKNVFRDIFPNTTGDNFTPATNYGDSTVYNYSYNLNSAWDATKIYTIAWVQEETSKEVINCGSSLDPNLKWRVICNDEPVKTCALSNSVNFTPTIYNLGNTTLNLKIKFSKVQAADWTSSLQANSNAVTDSVNITVNANSNVPLQLNVNTGSAAYLGEYYVTITDLNDASTLPLKYIYVVNAGITDLIINNDASWGDGQNTYSTYYFQDNYIKGLNYAGNTSFGITKLSNFVNIAKFNKLGNINHIYYNVGWSFPALTIENTDAFKKLLNNGGNMLISGQDAGWDTWGSGGSGNTTTKSFYTSYLKSNWVDDGNSANSSISTSDATDLVFGSVQNSSVVNVYGSGSNGAYFYPDQLSAMTGGKAVLKYSASKIAAIRSTSGIYKTVNIGFSIEQLSDTNVRKSIIKLAHDWFHGMSTSAEFDNAMQQVVMGQNFPNPSDINTTIQLSDIYEDMILSVTDVTGRVIYEQPVAKGTTSIVLNTSILSEGLYYYNLYNQEIKTTAKILEVMH